MKSKYGFSNNGEMSRNRSKGPNDFKGICKIWDITYKGAVWALRNGSKVSFWLDAWKGVHKPLIELETGSIEENERNLKVKDYVVNGGWNWNAFANKLPSSALLHIASIKPQILLLIMISCFGVIRRMKNLLLNQLIEF